MKATDIWVIIWISALSTIFIITMLALAWAIFEDTELGQAIVEHFKERWKHDA